MTVDEFEKRVKRLEELLVQRTAEGELEEAERLFAEEGPNSVWARGALRRGQSIRQLVRSEDDA